MSDSAAIDDDTFRIFIATDNHLGYGERGGFTDSFVTFEEILCLAKQHRADFVLLGGDLFHDSTPTITAIRHCMRMFRQYCLSDDPVRFQIHSDPAHNFKGNDFAFVNYNDPNLNVGLPVFSIHGNHDDPLGPGGTCALDVFHTSGLINLFGKHQNMDEIQVAPILMTKGRTQLALYGLGSCRDARLHRLFVNQQVHFVPPPSLKEQPKSEAGAADDWFNLFVVHQNRSEHGRKNSIPEEFLPTFLDFILWGHEHECRVDPEYNAGRGFYVCQPGSSVATSLCEAEAGEKFVALMEVCGKEFHLKKIRLQTVRPFLMEQLVLADVAALQPTNTTTMEASRRVELVCDQKVAEMLDEAERSLRTEHPQQPGLPLIRLRVDYSGGYASFSSARFGQKYVGKVANAGSILLFHQPRDRRKLDKLTVSMANCKFTSTRVGSGLVPVDVHTVIRDYFAVVPEKLQLRFVALDEMAAGVELLVRKNNKNAIADMLQKAMKKTKAYLLPQAVVASEEEVSKEIAKYRQVREALHHDMDDFMDDIGKAQIKSSDGASGQMMSFPKTANTSREMEEETGKSRRGAGTGGGRGSRGGQQVTLESAFAQNASGKFIGNSSSRMMTNDDEVVLCSDDNEEDADLWSMSGSSSAVRRGTSQRAQRRARGGRVAAASSRGSRGARGSASSLKRPAVVQVFSDGEDDDEDGFVLRRKQ